MRILVTGATGTWDRGCHGAVGGSTPGVPPRRKPERLNRFGWFDDIAAVTLDASDPVSAQAALLVVKSRGPRRRDYYLVHAIGHVTSETPTGRGGQRGNRGPATPA